MKQKTKLKETEIVKTFTISVFHSQIALEKLLSLFYCGKSVPSPTFPSPNSYNGDTYIRYLIQKRKIKISK